MFAIYTTHTTISSLSVVVYPNSSIAVPKHVLVGVGFSRRYAYRKFLDQVLQGGKLQNALNFIAGIFDTGEQKGEITITYNNDPKYKWAADVIKEFLEDNEETLRVMIPYLKQGMTSGTVDMTPTAAKTLEDLPYEDRMQIMRLMAKDNVFSTPVPVVTSAHIAKTMGELEAIKLASKGMEEWPCNSPYRLSGEQ